MSKLRRRGCTPRGLARQAPDSKKAAAEVRSTRHRSVTQRRPVPSQPGNAYFLTALVEWQGEGEQCTASSLAASSGDVDANPVQAVGGLCTRPCTAAREVLQPGTGRTCLDAAVPSSGQYGPRSVATSQCSPRGSTQAPPRRCRAATQAGASALGPVCIVGQSHECQTHTKDCIVFRKYFIRDRLFKTSPIVF